MKYFLESFIDLKSNISFYFLLVLFKTFSKLEWYFLLLSLVLFKLSPYVCNLALAAELAEESYLCVHFCRLFLGQSYANFTTHHLP